MHRRPSRSLRRGGRRLPPVDDRAFFMPTGDPSTVTVEAALRRGSSTGVDAPGPQSYVR